LLGAVALVAHSYNVPVLICCETYKLTNRVQLDSITLNELGDPDDVVNTSFSGGGSGGGGGILSNWKEIANLKLLSLRYDVCPSR